MPKDPKEAVALHRYALIAEAVQAGPAQRGLIVRALAGVAHPHPDGTTRTYSRSSLDRFIRAYRAQGLEGLKPAVRSDAGVVRRHPELFAEAAALRAELACRSAAHIADILWHRHKVRVAPRTIAEHLRRLGLGRSAVAEAPRAFGRYEAAAPNERWIGDVLVGPFVPHPRIAGSRRAKLFLLVDDHSRLLVHGRWMAEENTRSGQDVLRSAIVRRGLPRQLHVDNGAPYANAALERTCAVLGIRLIHSKPYSPQGRGKQERLNRFIRERFLAEVIATGVASFEELNDRFAAWAETVCNTRVHAETHQAPIERFLAAGPPRAADPALMADAFRWSAVRVVTKTASVSLAGLAYQVDAGLIGRRVELRYDPEDMASLDVYFEGQAAGVATPMVVGRHVHPCVPQAKADPAPPTGIDYLGLVLAAHVEASVGSISYRNVPLFDPEELEAEEPDTEQGDQDGESDALLAGAR
jgi:putative transposase